MKLKFRTLVKKDGPLKIPYTDPKVSILITEHISHLLESIPTDRRLVVVCIGTDRSTGDSLGPLVGTSLSKHKSIWFDLYGTLNEPVHAMNLDETLIDIGKYIEKPFIIGIDACLGQAASVGCIQVGAGPIRPGAGLNKELPPVGDIHVTGIVNVGGFMEYFVLQNTRLSLVVNMAEIISESLVAAIHKRGGQLHETLAR
jgi:putative sporulation protein YyaC